LATYFGTSPEFWLNLQTRYDLKIAQRTVGDQIKRGVRPLRKQRDPGQSIGVAR
jgi:plasmid maintenance system antidote protein VapI